MPADNSNQRVGNARNAKRVSRDLLRVRRVRPATTQGRRVRVEGRSGDLSPRLGEGVRLRRDEPSLSRVGGMSPSLQQ